MSMPESLIDQILSGLFPAAILKTLFTLLRTAQTFTATASNVLPANQIDPDPFAARDRNLVSATTRWPKRRR